MDVVLTLGTMSDSWAVPGARSAPATHWPPAAPADASRRPGMRPVRSPEQHRPPPQAPHRAPWSPMARPARPTYQETHRVTPVGVCAGAGATFLWLLVTALLGVDLASTMWVMLVAGIFAFAAAWLLASYGDRGVAVGIASVAGASLAVVGLVVEWHAFGGSWILW